MDKLFRAKTLAATTNAEQLVWQALHQDYSSGFVADEEPPTAEKCGEIIERRLLNVGHWGPLENPQITINFGGFPHSVMQQVRTHRLLTMDVQSFRYTGAQIAELGDWLLGIEDGPDYKNEAVWAIDKLFYVRPVGKYSNRDGGSYEQTEILRKSQLLSMATAIKDYYYNTADGMPYEMARGLIPFDYRQNFVLSANPRMIMHLLDMRHKKDAQLECQQWAELLFREFKAWMPSVAGWYENKRLGKGKLAP